MARCDLIRTHRRAAGSLHLTCISVGRISTALLSRVRLLLAACPTLNCLGVLVQADGPATDAEGWFSTGDVATIDADGFVQLVDRSKDVIKSGGAQ